MPAGIDRLDRFNSYYLTVPRGGRIDVNVALTLIQVDPEPESEPEPSPGPEPNGTAGPMRLAQIFASVGATVSQE